MNGEQSVRIVYISKAWAIDTIQTFWKRKVGAPGLGRIIYPAPQTFFRSWNSCPGTEFAQFGSARPCHITSFDMLHFIKILLVLHWISAEGKVN